MLVADGQRRSEMQQKDNSKDSTSRLQSMSKAMKRVANKYKSKEWRQAAKILDEAAKKPKAK